MSNPQIERESFPSGKHANQLYTSFYVFK